jgi:hypothetical protein
MLAMGLDWLGVDAASVALKWLMGTRLGSWHVFAAMGCMVAGGLLEAWGKRLGRVPDL